MKVILLSNVPKVGKKYDVVDVAPGYARNFLLAQGLGEMVTKTNEKRVLALEAKREAEKVRQAALLEKAFAGVTGAVITLKRAANEEGHLYAGVTREDLALELGKAIGGALEAEHIDLDKPLKALGEFTVTAKVGGKDAAFKVVIEAE